MLGQLSVELGGALAAKVADSVADRRVRAARDAEAIEDIKQRLAETDPIVVPQLAGEVHDIDGLLALYRHLAQAS